MTMTRQERDEIRERVQRAIAEWESYPLAERAKPITDYYPRLYWEAAADRAALLDEVDRLTNMIIEMVAGPSESQKKELVDNVNPWVLLAGLQGGRYRWTDLNPGSK